MHVSDQNRDYSGRLLELPLRPANALAVRIFKAMKRTRGRTLQRLRERILRADPLCTACRAAGRIRLATPLNHIVPLCKGVTDE